MKRVEIKNFGFAEVGGLGDMIYRVVRFPEYVAEDTPDGQVIKPLFTGGHPPKAGADYNLTGQELLVSLCNLYKKLNKPGNTENITENILYWCRHNVAPYNVDALCELMESDKFAHITFFDIIEKDAIFSVADFVKDLCRLGFVYEYFFALRVALEGDVTFAKKLYYEGKLCDSLAFFEKYKRYEKDKEYRSHILSDKLELKNKLIGLFPDFKMRLKTDSGNGKIMFGADIYSIFDICWYTFSRMVADIAPPIDTDMDYADYHPAILSCLCCGQLFIRHSSRQLYCNNPNCQAERNRKNRRACYARKKQKK